MASVKKCDNCDVLDDLANSVLQRHQTIHLRSAGLTICVDIPPRFNAKNAELCERCIAEMVSARFVELCALLAPYRPARVPGFIQGEVVKTPQLSEDEYVALTVLGRLLLKAP